jgi:hypothetical protein
MSSGHHTNPRLSRTMVHQAKYMTYTEAVQSVWHISTLFKILEDIFIFLAQSLTLLLFTNIYNDKNISKRLYYILYCFC